MNKTKTKNIFFILTIVFLVVLIFDILWFVYIRNSAEEVLELKKVANSEMSQNDSLISIKKDIASLEESRDRINEVIIDRDGVVSIIETLENIASTTETKLQISSVDIEVLSEGEGEKKVELYGELKMVLTVSGEWSGVTRYLNFLESLPHRVSIDSVRLSSVNNEEFAGWNMDVAITGITH